MEAEARRWKRERDARGIGEARERGDKRKEDFRVRVCVRVCERARAASWKDRKAERSEDAAKFPSSLEEGLPVRSPSDRSARSCWCAATGSVFPCHAHHPKKLVCMCVRACVQRASTDCSRSRLDARPRSGFLFSQDDRTRRRRVRVS